MGEDTAVAGNGVAGSENMYLPSCFHCQVVGVQGSRSGQHREPLPSPLTSLRPFLKQAASAVGTQGTVPQLVPYEC